MIVYGDPRRVEPTAKVLDDLRGLCADAPSAVPGLQRRAAATRLLIGAGELAQGLLDDAFDARGCDDWGDLEQACAALTLEAARLVLGSRHGPLDARRMLEALEAIARLPRPKSLTLKVQEGFAFYSLYPESYAEAARRGPGRAGGPTVVLGLRSIGASLAAVVAAASGADGPPLTLRPVGHPFRRTLAVGPRLERMILDRPREARFAIVDEGPGLSGSSFGCVADWLEERGVAPHRVHFFPGHPGALGPEASPRHRERWRLSARHVADEEGFLAGPEGSTFEDGIPTADLGLRDISGGRWRPMLDWAGRDWPPANPPQERRKYLYQTRGRTWLAKFNGLGRYGDAKLARGWALEGAGLIPPIRELRHGFLIQEWLTSARPLSPRRPTDRTALLEAIARYLAFLARHFLAGAGEPGSAPPALLEMARVNTEERFGAEVAAGLGRWREHLPSIALRARRVRTDNRMHAWEWLELPDGRLLKADALDHHQAHDCIGAQDLAWDVAGAAVEFDLDGAEQERLDTLLAAATSSRPDLRARPFYLQCYLAFQMGYYTLASTALATAEPAEASRLRTHGEHYASRLRESLDRTG